MLGKCFFLPPFFKVYEKENEIRFRQDQKKFKCQRGFIFTLKQSRIERRGFYLVLVFIGKRQQPTQSYVLY